MPTLATFELSRGGNPTEFLLQICVFVEHLPTFIYLTYSLCPLSECEGVFHILQCASGVYFCIRTSIGIACIGQHTWIQLENVGTGQFEASRRMYV